MIVSDARSHGRRQSAAETGALLTIVEGGPAQPTISVQADTHFEKSTQLFWPLPHCGSGVFQNCRLSKYESGLSACSLAQPPFSI